MANRLVVHFLDGTILKGNGYDFSPDRPTFHLSPLKATRLDEVVIVRLKQIKAVFFVKNFDGNPYYQERREFLESDVAYGRKIEVTCQDGEILVGTTTGYDTEERHGFFIVPVDRQSNNIRVFVASSAVREIREL